MNSRQSSTDIPGQRMVARRMLLRVDLLPRGPYPDELIVLVDILRSGTVAPILFDQGIVKLTYCASLRESRREASQWGKLLIGERGGMPPEGFNYASSPSAISATDFSGREAVLLSENAPRALPHLSGASRVLVGSLYNASAVARAVQDSGADRVTFVCSGFQGQEDVDDAIAAGFIAGEVARLAGGAELTGASRFSLGLLRAFPDPLEAIWLSSAGRALRRLQLADDLAFASMVSQSEHVPELVAVDPGERADLFHFEIVG